MPFSMAEIVNDPDFAQEFTITRSSGGSWQFGTWVNQTESVPGYGVIQPISAKELKMIPEGDRVEGMISFHSSAPIYETHTTSQTDATARISDTILWHTQNYRIIKVYPWEDFGYYKAIGTRMSGQ
jgi:hypothetical protein